MATSSGASKGGKDEGDGDASPTPSQQPEVPALKVNVVDGFVGKKRDVSFGVIGCESGKLSASSVAFASTSTDEKSQLITAVLKKNLDFGWYEVTFKCAGQPALSEKFKYTDEMAGGDDNGGAATANGGGDHTTDGNGQTSRIPEGAAQTGGGAAA